MRYVVALVALALSVAALAGCGSSSTNNTSSAQQVRDLQATVAALAARTPAVVLVTVVTTPPPASPTPPPTAAPTATATQEPLSSAILGNWVPANAQAVAVGSPYLGIKRIAFYGDGTTVVDDVFGNNQPGRYSFAGSNIKLQNAGGKVAEYTVSFDNGTLVLNDGLASGRFLKEAR